MATGFALLLLIAALHSRGVFSLRRLPRLYPYNMNAYKMGTENRLNGRDPDGSPLGPEQWHDGNEIRVREESGTGKSDLDKRLNSLKFGYENNTPTTIFHGTARKPQVVCSPKIYPYAVAIWKKPLLRH